MKHMLVIGGSPGHGLDDHMDIVFDEGRTSRDIAVVRCTRPDHLILALASAKERIELLDIFDHGGAGYMYLGREGSSSLKLFADMGVEERLLGHHWAYLMDGYLTDTAHVRLLGCDTALFPRGRRLLYKLGRALGRSRVAWGTIGDTHSSDFDRGEFVNTDLLFSSYAALDSEAPLPLDRIAHKPIDVETARPKR